MTAGQREIPAVAYVAEHGSDVRVMRTLLRRVLLENVEWLREQDLGVDEDERWSNYVHEVKVNEGEYLKTSDVSGLLQELAKKLRSRNSWGSLASPRGFGRGAGRVKVLQVSLRYLKWYFNEVTHVVFHADLDKGGPGNTFDEVRTERDDAEKNSDQTIVLALCKPEMEAWLCAGFEPRSADEAQRLKDVTASIGFDPVTKSSLLTSGASGDKKDAKNAIDTLCNSGYDRKHACVADTDLETLRKNGNKNGLADYLDDVRDRLCPAFTG